MCIKIYYGSLETLSLTLYPESRISTSHMQYKIFAVPSAVGVCPFVMHWGPSSTSSASARNWNVKMDSSLVSVIEEGLDTALYKPCAIRAQGSPRVLSQAGRAGPAGSRAPLPLLHLHPHHAGMALWICRTSWPEDGIWVKPNSTSSAK